MSAKLGLPQALPDIFTGLKVGAALSATAAVVAEFVASDRGLGYLLLQYNGNLETPMVFAIVVLLSLIGLARLPLYCSRDRKSTRLNSSHQIISYAVFCLKKKKKNEYSYQ